MALSGSGSGSLAEDIVAATIAWIYVSCQARSETLPRILVLKTENLRILGSALLLTAEIRNLRSGCAPSSETPRQIGHFYSESPCSIANRMISVVLLRPSFVMRRVR